MRMRARNVPLQARILDLLGHPPEHFHVPLRKHVVFLIGLVRGMLPEDGRIKVFVQDRTEVALH